MVSNPILVNVYALCVHIYWLGPHTYYKQWVMSCDWLVLFSACRWCCDWSVLAAIAGGHSWFPGVACATISGTSGWGGFWHLIKYVFILNKFIYIIDIFKEFLVWDIGDFNLFIWMYWEGYMTQSMCSLLIIKSHIDMHIYIIIIHIR